MTPEDFDRIDLLVLDVDGVMTDGKIILTPAGEEVKEFHVRDGAGMKYWMRVGKKLAIITGRSSPAVDLRAQDLGVHACHTGALNKLPAFEAVLAELGVPEARTAVIGDDLPELPMMLRCGLPIAVADAVTEVRQAARYVTACPGGRGAVREAIEWILRGAGLWDKVLGRYRGGPDGGATPMRK
jgi:3-deoxy-D-manno-octulosonate 8-phosphate phosphatase (KDO 8-P phosphatase)